MLRIKTMPLVFALFVAALAPAVIAQPKVQEQTYVITLKPAVARASDVAADFARLYGGTAEQQPAETDGVFRMRLTRARARVVASDPRVASISTIAALQPNAITEAVNWSGGISYTYDGSGNVRKIGSDSFGYDHAGRLISATVNGIPRNYSYDAFGNRTGCQQWAGTSQQAECQKGKTIDAVENRNRLQGVSYDAAGNVQQLDGHQYAYDPLNMIKRDSVGTQAREFVYTADDERIAVYDVGSSWKWSIRDERNKVLREFTSANGPSGVGTASWQWARDNVFRDGLLLASRQPENQITTTYYYHLDHFGTPRRLTDSNDRIVGSHDYYAFGPDMSGGATEPNATALKYTGHERDSWGGLFGTLDYMHARYYDPDLGRFLSVDPALNVKRIMHQPQGWNRYAYAVNSPMRYLDPDGREHVQEPGFTKPMTAENLDLQHAPWYIKASFRIPGEILLAGAGEGLISGARGLFAMARFALEERLVIQEAAMILRSPALREAIAALRAGKDGATFVIGKYEIVASTELEASAMTLRGMNGSTTFLLGRQALKSNAELVKTVLQETFRLLRTPAGEASVESAPELTNAAWSFAEEAAELFSNLHILP